MTNSNSANWSVGARSETGYVREENQDRMAWIRAPLGDVFVVSDGAGGHAGGGVAATLTVEILQRELAALDAESPGQKIIRAFESANEAVYREAHSGHAATRLMCATAVMTVVTSSGMRVAHVGDSRAYLYSRHGGLRRLTTDHSQVQRLLDEGLVTPSQARGHPSSSVLERAIGYQATVAVDVGEWIALSPDDTVLLCSDGLCGYVEDERIAEVLTASATAQRTADELISLALAEGGEDNVTVQVIRYGGCAHRAGSRQHSLLALYGLAAIGVVSAGLYAWAPRLPVLVKTAERPTAPLSSRPPIAATPAAPPVVASATAARDEYTSPVLRDSGPASPAATAIAAAHGALEQATVSHRNTKRHPVKTHAPSAGTPAHLSHVQKPASTPDTSVTASDAIAPASDEQPEN